MIKELILSLALSAASSLPFLDSPKKVNNNLPDLRFTCFLYASSQTISGEETYDTTYQSFSFGLGGEDELTFNGWGSFTVYFDGEEDGFNNSHLDIGFYNIQYKPEVEVDENYWSVSYLYEEGVWEVTLRTTGQAAYEFLTQPNEDFDLEANITFTEAVETDYSLTSTLTNCVILSVPTLPETFTANEVGNQYTIQAAANSGGYGFTSSSLSVTGAQVSNITYQQEQGNTGYYNGMNFRLTLQASNCTISITAYLPTYTLTSELNNCTVSPSLPATFNYGLVETYTFTANSGYAFNNVVTQWEITGANIGEITYSSLLYGNLYSQVSIELGFTGGNASVKVTAAQYDINSYQEGYDNGYTNGDTAGYNRGYSQGLTAGNSYGVWNWLKQAALTTGEFLSVPLLPGFSIGALLTAIAGLVIIWLFIKGFLFKS